MLDFDLARLYEVEASQLKRQVRRNIERFEGEDFMFELTREELLRCQIGTLNKGRGSNFKYNPFAFTEIGVAMLSGVLNSQVAVQANRKCTTLEKVECFSARGKIFLLVHDLLKLCISVSLCSIKDNTVPGTE